MTPTQVKRFRKRYGLTLACLSKRLGCALMTVWKWEHGVQAPGPENTARLLALAKELDRPSA